jgi:hypothetical protein
VKPALSRITLSLILVLTVAWVSPLLGGQNNQAQKPSPTAAAAAVHPELNVAPAQPLACIPGDRATTAALGAWQTPQTPVRSLRLMPSGGCTFSQCISEYNDCPLPKHPYCADYTNCICGCR